MKTRTKILIGTIITAVLITGGLLMVFNAKPTKQDYITFLKEHEQEMTDYVKENNPKVTSVQWDWDSAEVGEIGNGLPGGAGKALTVYGSVNEIKNSMLDMHFDLDEKENIIFESMWSGKPYIEGDIYE